MSYVAIAVTLQDQHLDWLVKQLRAFITEQALSLCVDQDDGAFLIDDYSRVRRRLDQHAEKLGP